MGNSKTKCSPLNSSASSDLPSASRYSKMILTALQSVLKSGKHLHLLEIASGSGQDIAYFAHHFPNIRFIASEYDRRDFESIEAYRRDCKHRNVIGPIHIDIAEDYRNWENKFEAATFDYMLNINMIHITPWRCTEGLFCNASRLLKQGGLLITFGPYAMDGDLGAESNVTLHRLMQSRSPDLAVRDVSDLKELAIKNGLVLNQTIEMPENNKTLIWKKC